MYTVDHIIGNTNHDDALGEAAEAHDSAGTLERVLLDAGERKKSRLRVHTEAGTDLGVLVDKPELEDGDVLYHDDDRMIVVSFEEREALTIDLPTETALSTALELGHRVGNQHWDLAVEGGTAYVAVEAEHRIVEDVFSEVLPPGADLDYEFVDPALFLDGEQAAEHSHEDGHSHAGGDHDHSHSHGENHHGRGDGEHSKEGHGHD